MVQNKDQILTELERIIGSETFSKTSTSIKLLRFLVNESIKGTELKEAVIGAEMFGKKYDPIKNDNKVRVYIYHLRKKLSQYYLEEADPRELVFSIEKGQYSVSFSLPEKEDSQRSSRDKKIRWSTIIATVILFSVVSYIVYLNRSTNNFWKQNFRSSFPNTVLIGDHFALNAPIITGGSGIIRDFQINSEADLNSYIQKYPDMLSQISKSSFSYVTKMGAYCSNNISEYFAKHHVRLDLMLNSEWDKSSINDENIIYIGQVKTMHFLKDMVEQHYPFYSLEPNHFVRKDPNTKEVQMFNTISNNEMIDYTIVAKMTGPGGNSYKFFLSEHDGGVISALKNFTKENWINNFYRQFEIEDKDFIALFKVTGWERTGYKMELEHLDFASK